MLDDTAIDIEDTTETIEADTPTRWIAATPLEEAYMWKKAIKARVVGKLSPAVASGEGSRSPLVFDFILPDSTAVAFLNGFCDDLGVKPRTRLQWRKWIKFWTANPLQDVPLSSKTKLPKTPRF